MTRFMWNSLDGGDNLFIKDKESTSDKLIHIKIFDGKYEFAEMMKKINELAEENEQLRHQLREYKENWDDMVELATKTSRRNVELDEQIGQLQRENEQLQQKLDFYLLDEFEWKEKYGE